MKWNVGEVASREPEGVLVSTDVSMRLRSPFMREVLMPQVKFIPDGCGPLECRGGRGSLLPPHEYRVSRRVDPRGA